MYKHVEGVGEALLLQHLRSLHRARCTGLRLRKSCLEEEAHGDFEANMEEDICDGVPGSEGVHFGCLVMVTPE